MGHFLRFQISNPRELQWDKGREAPSKELGSTILKLRGSLSRFQSWTGLSRPT
jgi:hypothetical protein